VGPAGGIFWKKKRERDGWAGHGPKAGARGGRPAEPTGRLGRREGGGGGWAKMGKEGGRKRKGFSFFSKSIFLDEGFSHF
jgi:hypothetical protein